MPRPDGRPYNFEKPAKPKLPDMRRKENRPAKPVPVPLEIVTDEPGKPGRPYAHKATPELVAAVCKRVSGGLSVESALVIQGLSRASVPAFLKRYPAAEREFETASHLFEEQMLAQVVRHAARDAKSAQWLLERRHAGQWAPVSKTEITGKGGAPIAALTLSKVLLSQVAAAPDRAKPRRATDTQSSAPRAKQAVDAASDTTGAQPSV